MAPAPERGLASNLEQIAFPARPLGRPTEDDLAPAAFAAGAAFLLLSPVVHPWYALWIVPWLALRSRAAGPWLLLSLALPLSYEVLLRYDGSAATWVESPWVRACVHLPVLAWLPLSVVLPRRAEYQ